MTPIININTSGHALPIIDGEPAQRAPVWVFVRPDLRRGAAVAADILTAMGKQLTWHGKGRNENDDLQLALAWMHAHESSDLVIANAQHAPAHTLNALRELAANAGVPLWLLHRSPIDDAKLDKINRMSTRSGSLCDVPPHLPAASLPIAVARMAVNVPDADFPTFYSELLEGGENMGPAAQIYLQQLVTTDLLLQTSPNPITTLGASVTSLLLDAPIESEITCRIRAMQVTAWRHDIFLDADLPTCFASEDRPTIRGPDLDTTLLRYRQPQRAIAIALTLRNIDLIRIASLTVGDIDQHGLPTRMPDVISPEDPIFRAFRAQKHLRIFQGATAGDPLLCQDLKSLARYVLDAQQDLGVNVAGRLVERSTKSSTAWLKSLGITIRGM
jgi:hypothetical protein